MARNCPECGMEIIGREGKKFCSDTCRNTYNNKINKDSNNYMRNINNRLRKNYRILAELNIEGKTKTTKSELINKGFDFDYITNVQQTKNGDTYFLYEQGYIPLDKDHYLLIKKDIL